MLLIIHVATAWPPAQLNNRLSSHLHTCPRDCAATPVILCLQLRKLRVCCCESGLCFFRVWLRSCPNDKAGTLPEQGLGSEEPSARPTWRAKFLHEVLHKQATTCLCPTALLPEVQPLQHEKRCRKPTRTSRGLLEAGNATGGSGAVASCRPRKTGKSAPKALEMVSTSAPAPKRAFLAMNHERSAATLAPSTITSAQVMGGTGMPAAVVSYLHHSAMYPTQDCHGLQPYP